MSAHLPQLASSAHNRHSRRSFLQIGSLGVAGLTLPELFRAEAAAGTRSSHKSVILIYLVGGPPHQDMFDLKPDAPKEIAGPWKPIATNVTGIQICEALPRLARIMDKLVVVRSLVGNQADHDAIQVYNGHHPKKPTPSGRLAAVRLRRRQAARARSIRRRRRTSAFVTPAPTAPTTSPVPASSVAPTAPFRPMGQSRDDMLLRGISMNRLADRKSLLHELRRHAPRCSTAAAR